MKTKKSSKAGATASVIIRFRATNALHNHLKLLAKEEEMSLGGLVRRLVLDTLARFPSSQDQ